MKLFTIPNIITLLNLLCGCLAIVFAFDGNLVWSAYLVGIAAVLDFLDGFVARALKQYSEIGKQLDSLADMVTFGVVPGVVMFQIFKASFFIETYTSFLKTWDPVTKPNAHFDYSILICSIAFLLTLFSALRLAKFNIDTRQSESFIGVPTPANAILICSFPLAFSQLTGVNFFGPTQFIDDYNFVLFGGIMKPGTPDLCAILLNKFFLIGLVLVMSFLLISEIPLFSLKFKSFGWKGNEIRWSFLGMCVVLLATLQFVGIPLAIVLYILMSIVNNILNRKSA
jgi:CDP-diacylglycerol--serine O-phosphatidyltransferase